MSYLNLAAVYDVRQRIILASATVVDRVDALLYFDGFTSHPDICDICNPNDLELRIIGSIDQQSGCFIGFKPSYVTCYPELLLGLIDQPDSDRLRFNLVANTGSKFGQ